MLCRGIIHSEEGNIPDIRLTFDLVPGNVFRSQDGNKSLYRMDSRNESMSFCHTTFS